jgi:hypothetical protein
MESENKTKKLEKEKLQSSYKFGEKKLSIFFCKTPSFSVLENRIYKCEEMLEKQKKNGCEKELELLDQIAELEKQLKDQNFYALKISRPPVSNKKQSYDFKKQYNQKSEPNPFIQENIKSSCPAEKDIFRQSSPQSPQFCPIEANSARRQSEMSPVSSFSVSLASY